MPSGRPLTVTAAALLLGALPIVAAHEDHGMNMDEAQAAPAAPIPDDTPPSYFWHPHQGSWMMAHITLMILGWVFVLPVAIMLSTARSRYHLPAQLVFHAFNGLGVFTGFAYNHSTPDLYENNSHHPIGWVVTSFTIIWTLASMFVAYGEFRTKRASAGTHEMSAGNMAHHNRYQPYIDSPVSRYSRDSGQGTERNSASLFGSRQNSSDFLDQHKPEAPEEDLEDTEDSQHESRGLLGNNRVDRFISRNLTHFHTPRASNLVRILQLTFEKTLLLLGFLALCSGFVVYGGVFRSRAIFSGLAHFIKGGIFFWYGLLTLGRWMGAFSEFGWAWNVRPQSPVVAKWKIRIPSAEFTESFVIWLYGASQVFMEHLNSWGKAWSAQDLEHVSITVLFFGGGLLGMLIESRRIREALNTNVVVQQQEMERGEVAEDASSRFEAAAPASVVDHDLDQNQLWTQPATYKTSLNPMPALVIMLLGMMMSGHHQTSMVSTMMHAQWGHLFTGFALARGVTYITMYLKPPISHYPARPPSEMVAAFCLTAGGLMFMMSARDTVAAIEGNGLDAMTIFTVTLGLAGALMAWTVVVYCIKGWAVRRERAMAYRPIATGSA